MGGEDVVSSGYNPKPYRGRPTNSHLRGGSKPPRKKECCPARAAMSALLHGRPRLARRYATLAAREVLSWR